MPQIAVIRILDAALNRAMEGLRVVEDYARFVLDDPFLTQQTKSLRHDLASAATPISSSDRHAARETQLDVGTTISTDQESQRRNAWAVCAASLKRTEQSLRSLEEYGKLINTDFAGQCESLRYRLYTLEKALDIGRFSRDALDGVTLCVLTDGCKSTAEFETLVKPLVSAGVGMIQLRDKNLDDRELIARARTLVSLTRRGLSPFAQSSEQKGTVPLGSGTVPLCEIRTLAIINDRPDIAAAVRADGVHIGQEDLSVKDTRSIVGTEMLIGVSTHNIEQARTAVLDGANYLGAGPTFPSATKSFEDFAGLKYLTEVAAQTSLPTFAIGGITTENLPQVQKTGITRIAVASAVTSAPHPYTAATNLLSTLNTPNTPPVRRRSALSSTSSDPEPVEGSSRPKGDAPAERAPAH
jgi:thiamine-phosphate pyrophosphorylase